jgi:membrane protein implicated in regulation of membrane protease activity
VKLRSGKDARVFARYLLFQLPGCVAAAAVLMGLVHWELVSPTIAYVLFVIWVVGEIALFPVLRIGYEPGGRSAGAEALVDTLGVAQEDLDPEGYVRVGAERWRAVVASGCAPVAAGTEVRVREVRQLTLVVEPAGAAPLRGGGAEPPQ